MQIVGGRKGGRPGHACARFSPLKITHGARTLRRSLKSYLTELRAAGLATLPGTAAEILDDEIRALICPDKLTSAEWLNVMREAHAVGLRSTATIMFGHVEGVEHWARHLIAVRDLQRETHGFTEFVPLPFVHMEAPLWRKGVSRSGPTLREALLMHRAVARLALHPHIPNIQTSWVKMGPQAAALCLEAGANPRSWRHAHERIDHARGRRGERPAVRRGAVLRTRRAPRPPPLATHHAVPPRRARSRGALPGRRHGPAGRLKTAERRLAG